MAGARSDVFPGFGLGTDDLEAPLGGEEKGDGSDVRVHVLACFGCVQVFRVVEEVEG